MSDAITISYIAGGIVVILLLIVSILNINKK